MKLGLLVVVAVAVLLPSFSESRIVSKCELRDKLREMIQLPRRLEEGVLTTVICEVDRRSQRNTSFVRVFGNRIPTTPKPTVTTAPSTTGEMTTAAPIQPTSTSSTTTQLTNTTDTTTTTTATTTSNTTTSPATTNSTISLMNTTVVSNSTGGGKRRKREAHSSSEEENKLYKKENKFNKEENKFNEEEDKFNEEGMVHFGSQMDDEDETSTEDDPESTRRPWSLGLYGLFQLSDKHFCDSGYRWSRNVCCTSCTAFADDDITDDIACVVNTGYWREILGSASHSCRHASNFFNECN